MSQVCYYRKKKKGMHKTDIDSILSELMFKKRNIKDP